MKWMTRWRPGATLSGGNGMGGAFIGTGLILMPGGGAAAESCARRAGTGDATMDAASASGRMETRSIRIQANTDEADIRARRDQRTEIRDQKTENREGSESRE